MEDFYQNSIKKTIISVSRNSPVALVVEAGSFLGSSLCDKLLTKGIQVIGVDNFDNADRENLVEASKNKNFHLMERRSAPLDIDFERLDYIFLIPGKSVEIEWVLQIFREHSPRLLFVSSIDLYSKEVEDSFLQWLKKTEKKVAKFSYENKLNARILRLGALFGPRMNFKQKDPMAGLIKKALLEDLGSIPSEFSTRALYIDDALDLLIKCILAGSTSMKIFDGVAYQPIKTEDVRQVLLDPLWHEQRNFTPQQLPPWPTPNLEKTMIFLNWHPKAGLVESLKKTLSYFKDHEIKIKSELPRVEKENLKEWEGDKQEVLQQFKKGKVVIDQKPKLGKKFNFPKRGVYTIVFTLLVFYALLLPIIKLSWGGFTFKIQIDQAFENLGSGRFDEGFDNISQVEVGLEEVTDIVDSLESARRLNLFNSQFESVDKLIDLATLSLSGAKEAVSGIQYLYEGFKAVTGELPDDPDKYFELSRVDLEKAHNDISRSIAIASDEELTKGLPEVFKKKVDSLRLGLNEYSKLVNNASAISLILPQIVAIEGSKSYLVLLQNNNELRPTGGFIGSYANVTFERGKLKKLDVSDIYEIDGQLNLAVEPPKEIREDLGQNRWFLRDSNWEADFPTSAKQAEWFFNKETGQQVSGVIALDVSAIENLLEVVGELDLPDYKEKITAENLFERAITHAEVSFFPGSQAKKNFITALSGALFNKLFFVPQPNWPSIVAALGKSLEEKHMSIFLDDPRLFSYLISQNWAGMLPRPQDPKRGEFLDFLAPVEANLGANKSNYYIKRSYNLETTIGKEGEIRHRLRISYTNTSPSDTWPAGKYKNRMRIYLPFGSKVTRVLWGENEITKSSQNFVDYGRLGVSMLLELLPKETKTYVLDYELQNKTSFVEGEALYKIDVLKQAGLGEDPFEWKLNFPLHYKLVSEEGSSISPQELIISTDLSKDRSFEVRFRK